MSTKGSSNPRNIRLVLEYDGTDFVGWQVQAKGRSVQGELEQKLEELLQEKVNVIGAGRTDAGVHARGQVANFRTATPRAIGEIHQALSALLPDDIVLRSTEEVSLDFHARFDTRERRYRYYITTEKLALHRQYSWYVSYPLDLGLLSQAAKLIEGQHDFEAFSKVDSGKNDFHCTVSCATWRMEGLFRLFEISADHFLRGMVRALVGTMVDVARGSLTIEEFREILFEKDRRSVGMAAPAKGLFLEEVLY